jgi:hypothetical protein
MTMRLRLAKFTTRAPTWPQFTLSLPCFKVYNKSTYLAPVYPLLTMLQVITSRAANLIVVIAMACNFGM